MFKSKNPHYADRVMKTLNDESLSRGFAARASLMNKLNIYYWRAQHPALGRAAKTAYRQELAMKNNADYNAKIRRMVERLNRHRAKQTELNNWCSVNAMNYDKLFKRVNLVDVDIIKIEERLAAFTELEVKRFIGKIGCSFRVV